MRVLNIAPQEQWIKYDDDLSLKVRRITVHEAHDIVKGTSLERLFRGETDGDEMALPEDELLGLCDRIFGTMVTGWSVQDPEGGDVPVTEEAWRWLLTDEPGLMSWLLHRVFLGVARDEAEVELEKGD